MAAEDFVLSNWDIHACTHTHTHMHAHRPIDLLIFCLRNLTCDVKLKKDMFCVCFTLLVNKCMKCACFTTNMDVNVAVLENI